MKTNRLLLSALMSLASMVSTAVWANGKPSIHIREIIHAGSGCPSESANEIVMEDEDFLLLRFPNLLAEVGPSSPNVSNRTNCRLYLDIEVPPGYSYAIKNVEYVGFSSLEKGIHARVNTRLYFTGSDLTSLFTHAAYGPQDKDLLTTNEIPEESMLWSPCDDQRAMNIETQISLENSRNRQGNGMVAIDSIKFSLQWKRCSAN